MKVNVGTSPANGGTPEAEPTSCPKCRSLKRNFASYGSDRGLAGDTWKVYLCGSCGFSCEASTTVKGAEANWGRAQAEPSSPSPETPDRVWLYSEAQTVGLGVSTKAIPYGVEYRRAAPGSEGAVNWKLEAQRTGAAYFSALMVLHPLRKVIGSMPLDSYGACLFCSRHLASKGHADGCLLVEAEKAMERFDDESQRAVPAPSQAVEALRDKLEAWYLDLDTEDTHASVVVNQILAIVQGAAASLPQVPGEGQAAREAVDAPSNNQATDFKQSMMYWHGRAMDAEATGDRLREAVLEPVQQARDLLATLRDQVAASPRLAPARAVHWMGNVLGHLDRALAPLPGVGSVTGAPDPGPQLAEAAERLLDHWARWSIQVGPDAPTGFVEAIDFLRIALSDGQPSDLEAVRKLWLEWRENGMANAITKAGEYMYRIGKVVEPDYPTDRLRAKGQGGATEGAG
jgi:hypothetical protein